MEYRDIKIGENTYYPLEQDSIDILEDLGCEYKGKLKNVDDTNGWVRPI